MQHPQAQKQNSSQAIYREQQATDKQKAQLVPEPLLTIFKVVDGLFRTVEQAAFGKRTPKYSFDDYFKLYHERLLELERYNHRLAKENDELMQALITDSLQS